MQKPNVDLGERAYEPKHIQAVLTEIGKSFPNYFQSFCPSASAANKAFAKAIEEWEQDAQSYEEFLDLDSLEEYDDDPNSFKNALKRECPIIRRCLNSSANEMKRYKISFNRSTGKELLSTTTNIVRFGIEHIASFDHKNHEKVVDVDSLRLTELLDEEYIAYGVIGGGIKSHFLYSRFPYAFPNRSQYALWALFFLTGKKDFGFEDGSEFLMIDADEEHPATQQNYHYPYDLFAYYSLCIYRILKEALAKKGVVLQDEWRYVYLDTFFNHVAEKHLDDINVLKGTGEYGF